MRLFPRVPAIRRAVLAILLLNLGHAILPSRTPAEDAAAGKTAAGPASELAPIDALPILAYGRLVEMKSATPGLKEAYDTLRVKAPILLCDAELARICVRAFLPERRAERPDQIDAILLAREKLAELKKLDLGRDPEIRKAHLVFFVKHRMQEELDEHFAEAAPYFERLGRHQRATATCMGNLRNFERALAALFAEGRSPEDSSSVRAVYEDLLREKRLLPPPDGSTPTRCPVDGAPYSVVRTGGRVGVTCSLHGSSEGLVKALLPPFSFAEDRAWHRDNAVVWARTVWARRLNRQVCLENIKALYWGLKRHGELVGSSPEGNALDVVEELRRRDCYPATLQPLCPMDGQPYRIEKARDSGASGWTGRIGCNNHGWIDLR